MPRFGLAMWVRAASVTVTTVMMTVMTGTVTENGRGGRTRSDSPRNESLRPAAQPSDVCVPERLDVPRVRLRVRPGVQDRVGPAERWVLTGMTRLVVPHPPQ